MNWSVALVCDSKADSLSVFAELDAAPLCANDASRHLFVGEVFDLDLWEQIPARRRDAASVHGQPQVAVVVGDGQVDGDEIRARPKGTFYLQPDHDSSRAWVDVSAPQNSLPEIHELRHAVVAIANEL